MKIQYKCQKRVGWVLRDSLFWDHEEVSEKKIHIKLSKCVKNQHFQGPGNWPKTNI